jgi:hypothetical protein
LSRVQAPPFEARTPRRQRVTTGGRHLVADHLWLTVRLYFTRTG